MSLLIPVFENLQVMGSEQLASVMSTVRKTADPELRERIERENEATFSSARLWDDGIIPPAGTRTVLGLGLRAALGAGKKTTGGAMTAGEGVAAEGRTRFGVFRM